MNSLDQHLVKLKDANHKLFAFLNFLVDHKSDFFEGNSWAHTMHIFSTAFAFKIVTFERIFTCRVGAESTNFFAGGAFDEKCFFDESMEHGL